MRTLVKLMTTALAIAVSTCPLYGAAQQPAPTGPPPTAAAERELSANELAALRAAVAGVEVLRAANRELEANNKALQEQVDLLTRDLAAVRQGERQQRFINGAGAVVAGIFATLLIVWLWPRKRSTEWR